MKKVKKGIPMITPVDDVCYGFLIEGKESTLKGITESQEFHLFIKPFMKKKGAFPQLFELKKKEQVIQYTAAIHSFFLTKGIKCSNPCFKTHEDWISLLDQELCSV